MTNKNADSSQVLSKFFFRTFVCNVYIFYMVIELLIYVFFLFQAAGGGDNAPPPEAQAPAPAPAPAPMPAPDTAPADDPAPVENEPAQPDQENSHAGNKVIFLKSRIPPL